MRWGRGTDKTLQLSIDTATVLGKINLTIEQVERAMENERQASEQLHEVALEREQESAEP